MQLCVRRSDLHIGILFGYFLSDGTVASTLRMGSGQFLFFVPLNFGYLQSRIASLTQCCINCQKL